MCAVLEGSAGRVCEEELKLGDIVFLEDINVQAIVQSVGCRLSMGNVETFFKENGVIQKILGADDVLQGETNDE